MKGGCEAAFCVWTFRGITPKDNAFQLAAQLFAMLRIAGGAEAFGSRAKTDHCIAASKIPSTYPPRRNRSLLLVYGGGPRVRPAFQVYATQTDL